MANDASASVAEQLRARGLQVDGNPPDFAALNAAATRAAEMRADPFQGRPLGGAAATTVLNDGKATQPVVTSAQGSPTEEETAAATAVMKPPSVRDAVDAALSAKEKMKAAEEELAAVDHPTEDGSLSENERLEAELRHARASSKCEKARAASELAQARLVSARLAEAAEAERARLRHDVLVANEDAERASTRAAEAQLELENLQKTKRARTERFGCPDTSAALDRISALPDTSSLFAPDKTLIIPGAGATDVSLLRAKLYAYI